MQPTQQTTWPYPPAPKRLPRRAVGWPWAALAAVLGIAVGIVGTLAVQKLTAGGSSAPSRPASAQTFIVNGQLHLNDGDTWANNCVGTGGYSDIETGAQVVVYDATGKSLAVGALGPGGEDATGCRWPFSVTGVPVGDGGPYSIEVTHRGKIVFTRAQAGNVQLSLG